MGLATTSLQDLESFNGRFATHHRNPVWRVCYTSHIPDIVPEEAEIQYLLRANTRDGVRDVVQRVKECAEGAARATRATATFVEEEGYEPRKPNRAIGNVFRDHYRRLGETMLEDPEPSGGSTDFGDISQKMPGRGWRVTRRLNSGWAA
ncbi:MAG: hypothetical protein ACYC9Q_12025 [Bacillota bacterium]